MFFIQNDDYSESLELRVIRTTFADLLQSKRYYLLGFAHYSPGHFTSVCLLPDSSWYEKSDMEERKENRIKKLQNTDKRTLAFMIYVRN